MFKTNPLCYNRVGDYVVSMLNAGKRILKKLNDSGYEAYFVGGFVRDQILGMPSTDIDITTNAHPEQVQALFDKTIPTGIKYGTVTVIIEQHQFEVTTYRMDQDYKNHRQPESIIYSSHLRDDLLRRDFTMNALVQDRDGHIVDLMGGKQDIINHLIRAIDDPKKRFKEDALRILRAVRFVGKLNFNIEEHTLESMIEDVHLLKKIPRERVLKELEMIFNQTHIQNVYHLLDAIHLGDVFDELDQAIHLLKHSNKHYAIEAVFALGIYPQMRVDKNHWRLSNKQQWTIEEVLRLMHVLEYQTINPAVAFQHDQSHILLADELLSQFFNINSQRDEIMNTYNQLTIHSIQDLSITGQLIQPLVHNHKDVGHIIDALVEAVLYERIENNQKDLLNYARNLAEALNETK